MYLKTAIGAFCAVMVVAGSANALTLTNREVDSQNITIIGPDTTETLTLAPGESSEITCGDGCTLSLANGTSQDFEGSEGVTIQDGGFLMGE